MLNRLRQAWLGLTGVISLEMVNSWRSIAEHNQIKYFTQLQRADEAAKLYNEGEIARKEASDKLGEMIIKRMIDGQ